MEWMRDHFPGTQIVGATVKPLEDEVSPELQGVIVSQPSSDPASVEVYVAWDFWGERHVMYEKLDQLVPVDVEVTF
jgi:hypothetical protein